MTTPTRPPPGPPTGVRIVIVGAGIGGLACAIESRQVGHEVTLLESVKQFRRLGDSIGACARAGGEGCGGEWLTGSLCCCESGRVLPQLGQADEALGHPR